MIETSLVPPRKSSATFGTLRQSLENVRRCSPSLRNKFGKSSEIFGKSSEIFGKSSKASLLVCLYNKQNNTWTLGDMEFIFSCSHSISHSFAALTRSISMWTLEDKFHIFKRPCVILYIYLSILQATNSLEHLNSAFKFLLQPIHPA